MADTDKQSKWENRKVNNPILIGFVLLFAVIGVYSLLNGRAAAPYIAINADAGSLANGAATKPCAGSSDGNCVVLNPASTGSGGGSAAMIVGLNTGNFGTGGAADTAGAVKYVRIDNTATAPVSSYAAVGVKVDVDFHGPYNTGGVSAIDANSWAAQALQWYQSNGCTPTECPQIEVLNEPAGTWFWGSNALSTANAAAYANLLKVTHNTFVAAYGASHPLILASYDGGNSGGVQWGQEVWAADSTIGNYVDGVTVHPYGGHVSTSAQGNRTTPGLAHSQTGKPVYATEVGWPTALGQPATGDSLQWSETDQCNNLYNFMSWARSTGFINAVYYFNYQDYGSNNWYGVTRIGGAHKPSYNALKNSAQGLSNPC